MSEVKAFLEKSNKLLGAPTEADIKEVKATLEALRKVSPDLVDSKIFERLSRLVDSVQIAKDTQMHVNALAADVKRLEAKTIKLTEELNLMANSFDKLDQTLTFEMESQRQRNKKLAVVLDGLEQYLRRHT